MKQAVFLLIVAAFVGACGRYPIPTVTSNSEKSAMPGGATTRFSGQPLFAGQDRLFAGSGVCATCHTTVKDTANAEVSIDAAWRASMMANAARDPYHRAELRGEVLSNPDLRVTIEDTCTRCHTPMARYTSMTLGGKGKMLDDGYMNPQNPMHTLAMDGVSCTLCHQITPTHLGERESFDGNYVIDKNTPIGKRIAFGPFAITEAQAAIMQATSQFTPTQGIQVTGAELCATCHTLYTPYVDEKGKVVGEFPEQMIYPEWQNSSYNGKQMCQDCHMPPAQGNVVLSVTGGEARSPFFQHVFVGGNTYMLDVFKVFGEELGLTVSKDLLDVKKARMIDFYTKRTATVSVSNARLTGSTLSADVIVKSLAGHKFPSGFPSRRVWLHFVVRDAAGKIVFESGAVKLDGMIVGNESDADPALFETHYAEIKSADQVQIYEGIMGDVTGKPTTTLLRGAGYLKDNRLLPIGFDKTKASEDIAVRGQAAFDPDFSAGGDTVRYLIDVGSAKGPFKVTVELQYQSIGYRWAQNLSKYNAAETIQFLSYYARVPNVPATVATAMTEVR